MFKERCSALLIFLGFVFGAEAHEQESLKTNEIHHIMDQIFSEHVNKKEISDQILHHAFLIYIDQFDPHGIYLLESEVAPYVKLTPAELDQAIKQYKANDFAPFKKLNTLIQGSIVRARKIREGLEPEVKKSQFLQSPEKGKALGAKKEGDFFAETADQLRGRILENLAVYIDTQKERIGGALTPRKNRKLSIPMRSSSGSLKINTSIRMKKGSLSLLQSKKICLPSMSLKPWPAV